MTRTTLSMDEYLTIRHALRHYLSHIDEALTYPDDNIHAFMVEEQTRAQKLQSKLLNYLGSAGVQPKLGPSDVQTQGNAGAFGNNKVA